MSTHPCERNPSRLPTLVHMGAMASMDVCSKGTSSAIVCVLTTVAEIDIAGGKSTGHLKHWHTIRLPGFLGDCDSDVSQARGRALARLADPAPLSLCRIRSGANRSTLMCSPSTFTHNFSLPTFNPAHPIFPQTPLHLAVSNASLDYCRPSGKHHSSYSSSNLTFSKLLIERAASVHSR
jgi:hypothetical protein